MPLEVRTTAIVQLILGRDVAQRGLNKMGNLIYGVQYMLVHPQCLLQWGKMIVKQWILG